VSALDRLTLAATGRLVACAFACPDELTDEIARELPGASLAELNGALRTILDLRWHRPVSVGSRVDLAVHEPCAVRLQGEAST